MHRIRIYHAALLWLAILAYLTGEWVYCPSWARYTVAIVITLRLDMGLKCNPNGVWCAFYPLFARLEVIKVYQLHPAVTKIFMLGYRFELIGDCAQGIAWHRRLVGKCRRWCLWLMRWRRVIQKCACRPNRRFSFGEGLKGLAWVFCLIFCSYLSHYMFYLVLFKRSLAKFMLFVPKKNLLKRSKVVGFSRKILFWQLIKLHCRPTLTEFY